MQDDPTNRVTFTVESGRFAKRKEESGRIFVLMSYPARGHSHITDLITTQIGNPLDVILNPIQGGLDLVEKAAASNGAAPATKDEPDAEMTEMIVNGEPAKVRRPRKSSNGNGHSAKADVPYSYHAFVEDGDAPGLCGTCHKRPEDAGHEVAPWAEEDKPLPHAFRHQGRSNRCGWCHLDESSELHVEGEPVEAFEDGSEIDALAQNLIDSLHEDDAQASAEAVGAAEVA